jgi:predicted permease
MVGVLSLGLGIGANTAIFTLIQATLLSPLPYPDAGRLVALWGIRGSERQVLAAYTDLMDWRAQNHSLDDIGIIRGMSVNLTGGESPERLGGEFVTASTFTVLGGRAARGRVFTSEEATPGTGREVVVLSDATWRNRFGADPNILGRTLMLNGQPHVVIGVMPGGYQSPFGGAVDVWLPITSIPSRVTTFERGSANVWGIGRLKAGVTPDQAQRDLSAIASQLAAEYPATNAQVGALVLPLREQVAGPIRPALLTMLGAVLLVLLIACTNLANLQLARAAARRQELSVRAALGAARGRLIRQLMTESLVLSLLGGGCGILLAIGGVTTLAAAVPGGLPALVPVEVNRPVLLFSVALTILSAMIFGLAPAWLASRTSLGDALRLRGGEAGGSGGRFDLRSILVAGELVLCIVLLSTAGLLARSAGRLGRVNPGFDPTRVLTFQFRLPRIKYQEPAQIAGFFARALEEVRRVPGVTSAALVQAAPFSGNWGTASYVVEGHPEPEPGREPSTQWNAVSDGYFHTMGIPLLAGRDFDARDRMGTLPVAIVNQEFARREWPGEAPLGRRFKQAGDSIWLTVAGVVGNAKQLTLGEETRPQAYVPVQQQPLLFSNVVARTSGDPLALLPGVRGAVWAVDRDQPVWGISSMELLLARSMASLRFTTLLTGAFAVVALLLSAIGVYGVASYLVVQRTREVGIRIAIGAEPSQVVGLMLTRGLWLTALAMGVGLLVSLGTARLLTTQLFDVSPADPLTYLGVTLILGLVALLARWIPARRAAQVDPMVALRSE